MSNDKIKSLSALVMLFIVSSLSTAPQARAQNKPVFTAEDKVSAKVHLVEEDGYPELEYDNITYQLLGSYLEDSSTYLIKTVKHFHHYNTFYEKGTSPDSITLFIYPNCSAKGAVRHTVKCDEFYFDSYRKYLIALSYGCCGASNRGMLSTWKQNRPFLKYEDDFFELSDGNGTYYVGVVSQETFNDTADLSHVATIYYSHNQQPADSIIVRSNSYKDRERLYPHLRCKDESKCCIFENPTLGRSQVNISSHCFYQGLIFYPAAAEEAKNGILIPIGLSRELPKEIIIP